jgi:glycosyltransferase involved in cell wall biosynthesis
MPDKKLRVVHVAPAEPFGGVQRLAIDLAAAQMTRDISASIVWTRRAELAMSACARAGVHCIALDGPLPVRGLSLAKYLQSTVPDIIHLHMVPPWVGPLLQKRSSLVITHLHSEWSTSRIFRGRISTLLERTVLARTDIFIAISNWVEKSWRDIYPSGKFITVYNGIKMEPARPLLCELSPRDHPIIGMGSRLAVNKGAREFVEFAIELNRKIPQAHFLVAGDGPDRAALEKLAAPLLRSGIITFLGFVEDMPAFWSGLDLAMFGPPKEPFGLRLIEPLAHHVPVVAYTTGSGSDEVVNLCRGIEAVPYGNPAELAELAYEILGDKMRWKKMAEEGFIDVYARFSLERMADDVERTYAQSMAQRRKITV